MIIRFVSILISVSLIILYFTVSNNVDKKYMKNQKNHIQRKNKYTNVYTTKNGHKFKGEKIVHLDLKGAPPKMSYYRKIFPLLAQLGATGLLIEYEDMFPYTGRLENITALNAYSVKDIDVINKLAKESNLQIIPLLPVFSHMEFILKLADFKEFREISSYPQVICPTHKDIVLLLVNMMEQIVKAHPDLEMIHIGTDQVDYLGQCSRCHHYLQNNNNSKSYLFLDHIKNVTTVLKIMFPRLRILMWDNYLRSISFKDLQRSGLSDVIEPVVWKSIYDQNADVGLIPWESYGETFKKVWLAADFKGDSDDDEFITHFNTYFQNLKSWISLFANYEETVNFNGIILTGHQRYDHFAVLSELFPVAIPSLAMYLRLLSGHIDPPFNPPIQIARILQCKQPYALLSPAFGSPQCSYPGGDILEYVIQLHQLKQEYRAIEDDSRHDRWMTKYNVKYSFSSPSHIESVTASLINIKNDLAALEVDLTLALSEVYDNYTVVEWKETYIEPFEKSVQSMWDARKRILKQDTWPRRPLSKAPETRIDL